MFAKQLSVFIENRPGRLGEVLKVLKENDVNIMSLSLADTTEYGLLRLIVNNPDKGKEMLSKAGFSTIVSNILVIKIPHKVGSLQDFFAIINKENVNVEYMYGLTLDGEDASIVLKATDAEKAIKILEENNIETLSNEQLIK